MEIAQHPAAARPCPPADPTDLIRAEQVAALYRNGPLGIISSLLALSILVGVLIPVGGLSPWTAAVFLLAVLLNATVRTVLSRAYARATIAGDGWRGWALRIGVSALAAGLTIGVGVCFLMAPGRLDLQLLVVITVTGIASGVVIAWGSFLPVFFASFYALMLPPTVWVAAQGGLEHVALAVLMLIYIAVGTAMARNYNLSILESLRLRYENLVLVADLRDQKELADQANVAKSRFLAAASHDLRQPVHALGMFVGALRQETLSAEARRLLEHIDASVSAMDELFTSLLDISRLDAGIVHLQQTTFAIDTLLTRVARDLEGEALRKGLRFSVRPSSAAVSGDPVLLERVLRNLASNAVRYTDRGGVVIAARPRGEMLSIEVWDTGRGIPLAQQENVFQEFFQLDNPERDRSKGLGLGLAIVRRLTEMLGCELSLRSLPGRGSVFKIGVRQAPRLDSGATRAPRATGAGGPARRGVIVVVDDEVGIRLAMDSLLESWGHVAVTGAGTDDILTAWSARSDTPDLIICDYRLRGGSTGVEVIAALRTFFGASIPAMLVTGDTAPDRLREAEASGYLLLHKPVQSGRLQAAVDHLLARRSPVLPG